MKDKNTIEYELVLEKEETIILKEIEKTNLNFKSIIFLDFDEIKEYKYIDELKERIYESSKVKVYKISTYFSSKYFDEYIEEEEMSTYRLETKRDIGKDIFLDKIKAKEALLKRYKNNLEYKKDILKREKERYEKEINSLETTVTELEKIIEDVEEELNQNKE